MKFLIAILFLLMPTQAFANENSAFDRVMKSQTIRCGYIISPSHLRKDANTGEFTGIAPEVIKKMAENLSLKIEWTEEVGWSTALEGLAMGRYDVLCTSVWMTTSRALRADALNPLDYAGVNTWIRPDDKRFSGKLADMDWSKIKIATIDGHVSDIIARTEFPAAQRVSLQDMSQISELYQMVADGKADVTFEQNFIGYEFIKSNPGKIIKTDHEPLRVFPASFLIPQGEEKLKAMLNVAQDELINSGFVDKVIDQHEIYPGSFYRVAKPYEEKSQGVR